MTEAKYSFAVILKNTISESQIKQIAKVFFDNSFSCYVYNAKVYIVLLLAHTRIDEFLKESENNMIQKLL